MKVYKQHLKGSVTVEYTLLLPILLIVYIFLIDVAIYQYNECLLTSNLYLIGNQRMELARYGDDEKISLLKKRAAKLYYEKYLLVEDMQTKYSVKGGHVEITGSGKMRNPLALVGIGDKAWRISVSCEQDVLDVTNILRIYKDIQNQLRSKIPKEE